MGCTNCGCSQSSHFDIGGGSYHCNSCGRHCKLIFSGGSSYCYRDDERERRERERRDRERREEEARKRREREKIEKERREEEARIRREREKREEEERKRNEEAEKTAKKGIRSLLNKISSAMNSISLNDFKFKTSIANKKSVSLKYEKVGNLCCSMNTVGSTYSESIDTSLKRERIYEQKNNYLYNETDELSLDNLRIVKTGKEKARFTKKF